MNNELFDGGMDGRGELVSKVVRSAECSTTIALVLAIPS